jgi:hypothetical protein
MIEARRANPRATSMLKFDKNLRDGKHARESSIYTSLSIRDRLD